MHLTETQVVVAYFLLSALMSTMPPVSEKAPYIARWMHDFAQVLGANLNKVGQRTNPTQNNPKGTV